MADPPPRRLRRDRELSVESGNNFRTGNDCILHAFRSRTKRFCRLSVSRSPGSPFRYARRKCRCGVLRNGATDEKDRASKAHISRVQDFELAPAVFRTLSKSDGAFCRSRKFFQTAGTRFVANFVQHAAQPAGLREIFIDLAVPGSTIPFTDKCSELR